MNLETDVICLDSADGNGSQSPVPVSCDQENAYTNQHNGVQSCLQDTSTQRSVNISHHSSLQDISVTFEPSNRLPEVFETQNTNHVQQTSTSPPAEKYPDHDERLDSPHSWLNKAFSPFSLDSPYYCPSEIDAAVFSDESLILFDNDKDQKYTPWSLDKPESPYEIGKSVELQEITRVHTMSPYPQSHSQLSPLALPPSDRAPPPISPTSTEFLAGDSPETGSDLDMQSPPVSPVKSSYTLSPPLHLVLSIKGSGSVLQEGDMDRSSADLSEHHSEDGQQISLVQFKKLKPLLGERVQDMVNISIAYFWKKTKQKKKPLMLINWPQRQQDLPSQ